VALGGYPHPIAGHGSSDDAAVRRLLGPLAGRTPADVADRLDAELPDGELRDDAAFLVIRFA